MQTPDNRKLTLFTSVYFVIFLLIASNHTFNTNKGTCPSTPPKCPVEPECPVASKEGVTVDGRSRYGRTAYGSLDQADDYFEKNLKVYTSWDNSKDIVAMTLKSLHRDFKRILDYGPSYASRMDQLCKDWKCELAVAVDPSVKGIARNKKDFPDYKFFVGSIDDHEPFPEEWKKSFDLIISSYTIDVVHRDYLFQALQNIHQYLAVDGILIIHVFAPYNQCFEQHEYRAGHTSVVDYHKIFEHTGMYRVIRDELLDYKTQRQYMHSRAETAYATSRVVMLEKVDTMDLPHDPWGGHSTQNLNKKDQKKVDDKKKKKKNKGKK